MRSPGMPREAESLASALAREPGARVLDVREAQAFALGHVAGAGRLSRAEFATRRIELPSRLTPVLVVHERPDEARAAAEALAAAGCEVHVPARPLCCGRPLYEFGLLDSAKAYLQRILSTLDADIRAGTPIVGLEPACVSVFREELPNLLAHDEQAKRLSGQVFLLSEFLAHKAPRFPFGKLGRKAVVHGHCHQQAVLKMDSEREVLKRLGLECDVLDSGCCGMAGSFGFEAEKYDVSVKCAERVLLPAVKRASADTLIVTNGFSCRAQIEELGGRRPHHLAELLRMALERA